MNRIVFGPCVSRENRMAHMATSMRDSKAIMHFSVFPRGGNLCNYAVPDRNGKMTTLLWEPPWKTMDPGQIDLEDPRFSIYGGRDGRKRSGSVAGSTFCWPVFGPGKFEETGGVHGEANTVTWDYDNRNMSDMAEMQLDAELPITGWHVQRTVAFWPGNPLARISTQCENRNNAAKNVTWAEHMNFGRFALDSRLYLPKGTEVHNIPGDFGGANQLFKEGAVSEWPYAVGKNGEKIDLSLFKPSVNTSAQSDFASFVFAKKRTTAWFVLHNPVLGIAVTMAWCKNDAPFLGRWIENNARTASPWGENGVARTQVMGLEPGNTPFASGIEKAVELGQMSGLSTYDKVGPMGTYSPATFWLSAVQINKIDDPQALVDNTLG